MHWAGFNLTIFVSEELVERDLAGQAGSFVVVAYRNQGGGSFALGVQVNIAGALLERHCE